MDIWTKQKRSQVMAKILGSNTKPEIRARKMLRSMGKQIKVNVKKLPGKPDIVIPKNKTIIFVHGCFWHLHHKCRDGTIPKSNKKYWRNKLLRNKMRDCRNSQYLRRQGWKVLRLWECEVEKNPGNVLSKIARHIN